MGCFTPLTFEVQIRSDNVPDSNSKNTEFSITKSLKLISNLGNGSHSNVQLYRSRTFPDVLYAAKCFSVDSISEEQREKIREDSSTIIDLDLNDVVSYLSSVEEKGRIYVVSEYVKGCSLNDFLRVNEGNFGEREAALIVGKVMRVIQKMHINNIIHGDIRPENIIFPDKNDCRNFKLIDFSFISTQKTIDKRLSTVHQFYLAPEKLILRETIKSDVWSVGVLTHFLLTKKYPFSFKDYDNLLTRKELPSFNPRLLHSKVISETAVDFISKCLVPNQENRLSSLQALKHPWIDEKHGKSKKNNLSSVHPLSSMLSSVDLDKSYTLDY